MNHLLIKEEEKEQKALGVWRIEFSDESEIYLLAEDIGQVFAQLAVEEDEIGEINSVSFSAELTTPRNPMFHVHSDYA